MNKKIIGLLTCFVFFLILASLGFKGEDKNSGTKKITSNDNYNYIAINQIFMWISNDGDGSHSPLTDAQGFFWPGGPNATKGAIFEDGLLWGGKIGREIRVGGSTYRHGLQAGKILPDGTADNPDLDKYRVYKIRKGWESLPPGPVRDQYEKDFNEWPVEDGAPWVDVDGDGVFTRGVDQPKFVGDEVLWYVSNDLDAARTTQLYGTLPMGMEVQSTVFGFNRTGALGDMVFEKFKIINKGQNTIRDMIVGYWSDTDLGDANDDYTGCDTALSLGYTYNGTNNDLTYGTPPPAIGYDFFQGPIVQAGANDSAKFLGNWKHGYRNLPMTAFAFYINSSSVYADPDLGLPSGSIQFYNYMQGLLWDGQPFIDPHSGEAVKFVLAGDPVAKTGWYEGSGWPGGPAPGDRRHFMASGPFDMAPGDTQEVVVGLVIAVGGNNIQSVSALKEKDNAAQIAYDLDFQLTPSPDNPIVHKLSQDRAVTLWWEPNSESYHAFDPLLPDTLRLNVSGTQYTIPVTNKYFDFEGYRVWQFKDLAGTDPVLLATYDIKNGIGDIRNYQYDYILVNGGHPSSDPIISGPDEGLQRYITITQDAYSNGPLYDGNPYYFAVTAYGYSKFSDPPVLESPPAIQEVFPGIPSIDVQYSYGVGDNLTFIQTAGGGDGVVSVKVIDPTQLTGHKYKVVVTDPDSIAYTLIDETSGDTLLRNQQDIGLDSLRKPVVDGFILRVQNTGKDSALSSPSSYGIKNIVEVKGPGGSELSEPVNVFENLNSTKQWKIEPIKINGTSGSLSDINYTNQIGYHDYEIRFLSDSSEYYTTGYAVISPTLKNDPKGHGKIPFQIWDVGHNNDEQTRLITKVNDVNKDTQWTAVAGENYWESIYAYIPTTPYSEPLPPTSGTSNGTQHKIGNLAFSGSIPAEGTIIRINTWKPLGDGDVFEGEIKASTANNKNLAKNNIKQISVFPNPYFGSNALERDKYQRFMRFTNLPNSVTVRIYSLSGVFIKRIDKSDNSQYLDWDLRNKDGLPVASGMYIAYLDMPGIGTKIMKLAVIMETQFIDRL